MFLLCSASASTDITCTGKFQEFCFNERASLEECWLERYFLLPNKRGWNILKPYKLCALFHLAFNDIYSVQGILQKKLLISRNISQRFITSYFNFTLYINISVPKFQAQICHSFYHNSRKIEICSQVMSSMAINKHHSIFTCIKLHKFADYANFIGLISNHRIHIEIHYQDYALLRNMNIIMRIFYDVIR